MGIGWDEFTSEARLEFLEALTRAVLEGRSDDDSEFVTYKEIVAAALPLWKAASGGKYYMLKQKDAIVKDWVAHVSEGDTDAALRLKGFGLDDVATNVATGAGTGEDAVGDNGAPAAKKPRKAGGKPAAAAVGGASELPPLLPQPPQQHQPQPPQPQLPPPQLALNPPPPSWQHAALAADDIDGALAAAEGERAAMAAEAARLDALAAAARNELRAADAKVDALRRKVAARDNSLHSLAFAAAASGLPSGPVTDTDAAFVATLPLKVFRMLVAKGALTMAGDASGAPATLTEEEQDTVGETGRLIRLAKMGAIA